MDQVVRDRETMLRVTAYIATSTLIITACFIGVVAVITGFVADFEQRLPIYVLVTAVVFVAVVVVLDSGDAEGMPVLLSTVSIGVVTFVIVSLTGEGLRYAVARPGELVASQLVFYFVAAALFCTGVGYWALNHWREFADDRHTRPRR
jgi:predicted neutral ceramidase superfamily lipid hydrolase